MSVDQIAQDALPCCKIKWNVKVTIYTSNVRRTSALMIIDHVVGCAQFVLAKPNAKEAAESRES